MHVYISTAVSVPFVFPGEWRALPRDDNMKLQIRLLPLFLVVCSAKACNVTEETLNKREGEYEFEVKREDSSAPAIHAGSQGSVLDDANVDDCSRTWFVWENGTCTFGDGLDGIVKV